ncbi:MAG: T9SS type A sorting domain-containing protein, partial [Saprospiraceae bacterium]
YDVRLSQNNVGLYFSNFGGRVVHTAFMGDPTLRNDVLPPVFNVLAVKEIDDALIVWTHADQDAAGYHLYVRTPSSDEYIRINDELITGVDFTYPCLSEYGIYRFMVRAVKLHESHSGSYYNMSQGIYAEYLNLDIPEVVADASFNANNDIVAFTNSSIGATSYLWLFGDGESSTEVNPVHDYFVGDFDVTLIASNECVSDTIYFTVSILTSVDHQQADNRFSLSPNPSHGKFTIQFPDTGMFAAIRIYSLAGKLMDENLSVSIGQEINISAYPAGIYVVRIESAGAQRTFRLLKE